MSLRMLAPAALLLFAVVLLIVVVTSVGGGDGDSSSAREERTTRESGSRSPTRDASSQTRSTRHAYTVKPGDTLGGIAAKTGITIEELMSLNPAIDPRALVAGQKLKLGDRR